MARGSSTGLVRTAVCVLALAAVVETAASTRTKTLDRRHDPVVLTGADLPEESGRDPSELRLYAVHEGKAAPIPFQIDERYEDGELVLPDDEPDEDERDTPGLDANDELVFMAMDAGDRASRAALPESADRVTEIEISDPRNGKLAWAYLLHFPGPAPAPSERSYVHFDAAANQATSDLYTVDYHDKGNFFTSFRIAPEAGGSGENLVHRTRMRGAPTFSYLLGTFTLEFTEEDSMMELSGVKNGPVRAIRRVDLSVDLGPLFPELPTGRVETHHFRSSFLTPIEVSIPWVVLNFASEFSFVTLTDFRPVTTGGMYFDANHPAGLAYEGDPELILTPIDHDWWVKTGADGNFLQAFITPGEWQEWDVIRGTVFVDQETRGEDEDEENGRPRTAGKHAAGFSLVDVEDIPEAGDYGLRMFTAVFEKPYEPGDERDPMAMIHIPLETKIQLLAPDEKEHP